MINTENMIHKEKIHEQKQTIENLKEMLEVTNK